uniref:Glutathione peroxidase n=1 Tax=Setaria digitata TaxID=48799 RepID=A0A915PPU2_9BILA
MHFDVLKWHRSLHTYPGKVAGPRICVHLARTFFTVGRFTGTTAEPTTIYDFTVKDADGKEVKLDKYRGKAVVIVNVASQCSLADANYQKLKKLAKFYKDKGLVIAAFPCNQFGSQERSCAIDVKKDVKEKYQYEPDIYDKIEVNGENAHPLYNFLKKKESGSFGFPNIDINSDQSSMNMSSGKTVYNFTMKDAEGKEVSLDKYRGKPLIIVNVASQCGLTNSNYTELKELMEHYKDKGLAIAAFPCNQFGGQEPKCELEVKNFVAEKFHFVPDLYAKIDVNGKNAAPLFDFLKHEKGGLFGDNIKWNFTKFLIDQEGHPVKRYAPTTSPKHIMKDIDALVNK